MSEARLWKIFLTISFIIAALFVVVRLGSLLIPFVFGLVLAYLVHPLTDRFVAMGLRRDRVVLVLYFLLFGVLFFMGGILLPILFHEIQDTLKQLPQYAGTFDGMIDYLNRGVQSFLQPIIGKKASSVAISFRAEKIVELGLDKIPQNIGNLAHFGLWIFIVPFVSFFGLTQGKNWLDRLFDLTPSAYVENLLGLLAEVNATLGGYIRGQIIDGFCVGLLTTIGLWFLGFNGAVLLGCVTGVLNVVPLLAPIVGGSLALLFGYFQGLGISSLFGIFWLYVFVRLADDFVFMPFIVGHSVNLHPVVILLAILAGFELGGILGLVFAVPAAAIIKVVLVALMGERREAEILQQQKVIS